MADSRFFSRNPSQSLHALATLAGARIGDEAYGDYIIDDVAPLDRANANEISFLDNPKYV